MRSATPLRSLAQFDKRLVKFRLKVATRFRGIGCHVVRSEIPPLRLSRSGHLTERPGTFVGPVAGSLDREQMGPMGEAIEPGRGHQGVVSEGLGPFLVGSVAGGQDRPFLVAFADQLVEQLRFWTSERAQAEVIEDQQVGSEIASQSWTRFSTVSRTRNASSRTARWRSASASCARSSRDSFFRLRNGLASYR
jgi:hypothetical protein